MNGTTMQSTISKLARNRNGIIPADSQLELSEREKTGQNGGRMSDFLAPTGLDHGTI